MANNLTNNPLRLDTAAAAAIISSPIQITSVVWAGGAIAAADTVVLTDKNGIKKVEFGTSTADDSKQQTFDPPLYSDGLIALTIGHGEVLVYWTGRQPTA